MKTLITGGTGFVGRYLAAKVSELVIVGRSVEKIRKNVPSAEARQWDPSSSLDPSILEDVDVVVNLAGESVFNGRWNQEKKKRIMSSRVDTTRHLVDAIAAAANRPKILINASAIGYYGNRGNEELSEKSSAGDDFLAQVCINWEKEALRAEEFGVRVVLIRVGVVLGRGGGALEQMLLPFKMGVGGKLGSGRQYMPWVHIEDLTGIMLHAIKHNSMRGPVNGVAPNPVTNAYFTKMLAKALHRPALLPVPAFGLKALMGEFGTVLLSSQRAVPRAALEHGYDFAYPDIADAFENLVS